MKKIFLKLTLIAWLINKIKIWKHNFHEHQRRNLLKIFLGFCAVSVGTIILANVMPRPSNVASTELNTPVTFGTLGKSAELTKTSFNNKNGVLQMNFVVSDSSVNDEDLVNLKHIKVTAVMDHGGSRVTGKVMPTSNNTLVVQFENLSARFNAVTVNLQDKNIDEGGITTPDNVTASSDEKNVKSSDTVGKFTVNRDKVKTIENLEAEDQIVLAKKEYDHKISAQKELIKSNRNAIAKYNKAIIQNKATIATYMKRTSATDSDNNNSIQDGIKQLDDKIVQDRQQVAQANENISTAKRRIIDYQSTKKSISSGKSILLKAHNM